MEEFTVADKEQIKGELSHMIADLNEVHMKLDSLLGKISISADQQPGIDNVEGLRRTFDQQLDRIREKLSERLRSAELSMT